MAPEYLIDLLGEDVAEVVTRLLISGAILLVTFVFTRRVNKIVLNLVLKLAGRTKSNFDERLIGAVEPPMRMLVVIFGLWVALTVLGFSEDVTRFIGQSGAILVAVAIFWAAYRVTDVVADALAEVTERDPRIDRNLVRFGRQLVKGILVIFAFVVTMEQLGYNLNGLLAGLGIGGLAVALAAQEALSNLIGYFIIMADSPFTVGNFIVSDAASGVVEGVGFRSTRIRQLDQGLVFVPNSTIARSSIINWSRLAKRRLDLNIGLTYDTHFDRIPSVVEALRDMLQEHERVIDDTVFVQFMSFGDSSLNIRILCYVDEPDWTAFQKIKQDINLRIMKIVDYYTVEFAFPTQTIVLHQATPPEALISAELPPEELPEKMDPELDLPQPDEPETTDEIADADES